MSKLTKITVAITLFMFMGQSFAALLMSCDISPGHNSVSVGSGLSKSDQDTSIETHLGHMASHSVYSQASLNSLPDQAACDSEQQSCQCVFGACSALFLPVDSYTLEYSQGNRLESQHKSLSSSQLTFLFRPPISA